MSGNNFKSGVGHSVLDSNACAHHDVHQHLLWPSCDVIREDDRYLASCNAWESLLRNANLHIQGDRFRVFSAPCRFLGFAARR